MNKYSLSFLLVLVCFVVLAKQGAPVLDTSNMVGYVRFELSPGGKAILIGVNFGQKGNDPTLKSLLGSSNQLKAGKTPSSADQIHIWDAKRESYSTYAMRGTTHEFYPCSGDRWTSSVSVDPIIPRGSGFWIVSAADSTEARQILVSGSVSFAPSSLKVDKKSQILLLSAPSPEKDDPNEITAPYHPLPGDQIGVLKDGLYTLYILQPDGSWQDENKDRLVSLEVGKAFWFIKESRRKAGKTE